MIKGFLKNIVSQGFLCLLYSSSVQSYLEDLNFELHDKNLMPDLGFYISKFMVFMKAKIQSKWEQGLGILYNFVFFLLF